MTSDLTPGAFLATLPAALGLSAYTLPESNVGSTDYIEHGSSIPTLSYGTDPVGGRLFTHLGYFNVEVFSDETGDAVDGGDGHFIPFVRYSDTQDTLAVVCDHGAAYGGEITRNAVEAFTEARLTGMTTKFAQGLAPYSFTVYVRPLGGPSESVALSDACSASPAPPTPPRRRGRTPMLTLIVGMLADFVQPKR